MKRKDFNTTKEYIEYLIFEDNFLNSKSILIFLIIIGAISIISLQLFRSNSLVDDDGCGDGHSQEYLYEVLLDYGYSSDELNKLNIEELDYLYHDILKNNKGQYAGEFTSKEFPKQDAAILKQDYYLKAAVGDFKSIVTDFEDKKLKYLFSEQYNKELITIYNDAYYLKTIIGDDSKPNNFNVKQVLSNVKDPQMLVYGTLLAESRYSRDTIVDVFSLSPILSKKQVTVTSTFSTSLVSLYTIDEKKRDSKFIEMGQYLNEGDYILYRFEFTIDNNPLKAYIYKDVEMNKLSFYGMYSENKDIYLRVYDFTQIGTDSKDDYSSGYDSNYVESPTSSEASGEPNNNLDVENNDSFTGNNNDESTIENESAQNNTEEITENNDISINE